MRSSFALFLFFLLLTACTPQIRPYVYQGIATDAPAFRYINYWEKSLKGRKLAEVPLAEKIISAPPELISYVKKINELEKAAGIALPVTPDSLLQANLDAALKSIPPEVMTLINSRLLRIVLLTGLGSSGMVETVFDSSGHNVAGIVFLDADLLSHPANDWATWRENTPFAPQKGYTLKASIVPKEANHAISALRFILLHEFGHIVSINRNIHPNWDLPDKFIKDLNTWSWPKFSWTKNEKGMIVTKNEVAFSQRKKIVYYREGKIPLNQAAETYVQLEKTDIPALYGALNVYDDFAESFATYIHVELLNLPFQIEILHYETPIYSYSLDWSAPRYASKKAFFENMITTPRDW